LAVTSFLTCGLAFSQAAGSFAVQHSVAHSSAHSACPSSQSRESSLSSASSLLEQSRFTEAASILNSKTYLACDPRANLLYAASLDGSGDIAGATRVLADAHKHWPSDISLATSLARYYLRSGDFAQAATAVASCRPASTTPLPELQVMAMAYLENHDLPHAKSIAVLAYHGYPSEENLLFTANVLQLQGRFMDVVRLLEKQRSAYGNSALFLITLAESESDGMMYRPARKDLERAAALCPDSYPAHYLLGNLLARTGDSDGAIREFEAAIRLSPRQPRTYVQLGLALEKRGQTAEARKNFETALSVDDHYGPAYCELGKIQLRANDLQGRAGPVEHIQSES
jgi:tetratricopeptide (TPR) repeat protein